MLIKLLYYLNVAVVISRPSLQKMHGVLSLQGSRRRILIPLILRRKFASCVSGWRTIQVSRSASSESKNLMGTMRWFVFFLTLL